MLHHWGARGWTSSTLATLGIRAAIASISSTWPATSTLSTDDGGTVFVAHGDPRAPLGVSMVFQATAASATLGVSSRYCVRGSPARLRTALLAGRHRLQPVQYRNEPGLREPWSVVSCRCQTGFLAVSLMLLSALSWRRCLTAQHFRQGGGSTTAVPSAM